MDFLKTIGIGIAGVVVGLLLAGAYSGGNNLGGVYNQVSGNFPALVVSNGNATTSTSLGKACITMTRTDGTTVYWFAKADGNLGTTTSSSCVQ
jgi:hypothetical protein